MSNYSRCKICGDFDFLDRHECPPIWKVIHEGEVYGIRGVTVSDVAENYAKKYNEEGEYEMMNGGDIKVQVCDPDSEQWWEVEVSAEPSIDYHTNEKEIEPPEEVDA